MNKNITNEEVIQEYKRRFTLGTGEKILDSEKAVCHLRSHIDDPYREHFITIFMNTQGAIIATDVITVGTINASMITPREFGRKLLQYNASAAIISHNHPGGSLTPSPEDKQITKRMQDVCKLFGVTLHDHLIITADSYYSFADNGLM